MSQRWSAIFCATGVWGGKPVGRVRVDVPILTTRIAIYALQENSDDENRMIFKISNTDSVGLTDLKFAESSQNSPLDLCGWLRRLNQNISISG